MGILSWLIIGGLAGWIASKIMGTDAQMGTIANIIVGIIGGVGGGYLMSMFGKTGINGFSIHSFLVALLGSVILLWIVKLLKR